MFFHPNHSRRISYELANRPINNVIVETGAFALITVTAFVGNSCVLYVFYKTPRLRTITSYYIMALAISDISMAVFVMTTTVGAAWYGRDIIGNIVGHITAIVGYTLVFGSLQTTSLIALNRFFCVVKSNLYKRYFSSKTAIQTIIAVWVLSVLNPVILYVSGIAKMEFSPGRYVYILDFKDETTSKIFAIVSVILFSFVPLSLTSVCYYKIYKTVTKHNDTVTTSHASGDLSKTEIDITKSVLAVVCGFVICWIPCTTIVLVSEYKDLSRQGEMLFTYSAFLSSAINPIIFNVFNKPFKKHMRLALCPRGVFPAENAPDNSA